MRRTQVVTHVFPTVSYTRSYTLVSRISTRSAHNFVVKFVHKLVHTRLPTIRYTISFTISSKLMFTKSKPPNLIKEGLGHNDSLSRHNRIELCYLIIWIFLTSILRKKDRTKVVIPKCRYQRFSVSREDDHIRFWPHVRYTSLRCHSLLPVWCDLCVTLLYVTSLLRHCIMGSEFQTLRRIGCLSPKERVSILNRKTKVKILYV